MRLREEKGCASFENVGKGERRTEKLGRISSSGEKRWNSLRLSAMAGSKTDYKVGRDLRTGREALQSKGGQGHALGAYPGL